MTHTGRPSADEAARLLRAGLFIGGDWVDRTAGGEYAHHDQTTGRLQQVVPLGTADDVDHAVRDARAAFRTWGTLGPDRRRTMLLKLADLLREHADEMATIATLENAVPSAFSGLLAGYGPADWFTYYAGWADKIEGTSLRPLGYGGFDYTVPEPFGVIAVVIPWNGPVTTLGMKVAPALAAGNCVVLKPSEFAPFTTLRFAELAIEAGFPPGVINVVVGGADAGDALVRHPGIDKISFTGGTATGQKILATAAQNVVPTVMELGGKAANVVFPDVTLAAVIPQAVITSAMLSGQFCACPSRLLVHTDIYDEAVAMAEATAQCIALGDPFDSETMVGPMINAAHRERVEAIIERARAEGNGRLLYGGSRPDANPDGFFLTPTVFADVDHSSPLAQEEIFGPVLSITRFRDDDHAVKLANGTRYGLVSYVWTNDLTRAHEMAAQLRSGTVSINAMMGFLTPNTPYGGVGASGFGREGGHEGLKEFLRTKNVYIGPQ
ncbi:aldehyde dehydrogenase family protein [Sporichthya brevicatena]|uniref:Aldehyde dehydrogenase family protein n=1 Tax=Sporichthya brevicatena TaxID=171442 RepID=A0ABN1G3V5_9ACTN